MKLAYLIIIVVISFLIDGTRRSNARMEKQQQLIDNCVLTGGKVETVGEWYTNSYLICYPKEQK